MSVYKNINLKSTSNILVNALNSNIWTSNNNYISYKQIQVYNDNIKINNNNIASNLLTTSELSRRIANISNLYYDKSIKLETRSDGVNISSDLLYTVDRNPPSDIRLKNVLSYLDNSLDKIINIDTFKYKPNETSHNLYGSDDRIYVGVNADDVNKVFPELVSLAGFDKDYLEDGSIVSKSGSNYLSVSYERFIPILIECVKELKNELNALKC